MIHDSSQNDRHAILAGFAAAFVSVGALVAQVLALATEKFQATLNSDYLLAHAFSRELFVSPYPVSGWKFGMGSFAFPDYAIYLPWYAAFGDAGGSYPAYAATLWLGYFFAFAWALRATGVRWAAALAASGVALNMLLATRLLDGAYADRLWQLSLPAYHGGNLLLELCCFALIFGAVRAGEWSRRALWAFGVIAALGIFSNAQLLLHLLLPVGVLLWASNRFGSVSGDVFDEGGSVSRLYPEFPVYLRTVVIALAVAIALRVALALGEVFYFASLFKAWPLPWVMWDRLVKLLADFRAELWPTMPVFWCVALAGLVVGAVLVIRSRRAGGVAFFAPAAVMLTLLAITATPVLAMYWKDAGSCRYLLPWFVFPAWILAFAACGLPRRVGVILATVALAVVAGLGVRAVPEVRRESLVFPHSPESLALRDYLRVNGLRFGLCHFWEGHTLQNAWSYDGPRLSHIRDKDFCEFWCNNAFSYFPEYKGDFGTPVFDFLILNHLDTEVLRQRLGGDFTPVAIGPYSVVKLTPEQAQRASALVERQALDFLAGRRADFLKSRLHSPLP